MDSQLLDKWLNGTHTPQELATLETYPEFVAYQKIDAYTKQIETPTFNTEAGLQEIKEKLARSSNATPKVIALLPRLLKIAAVLAVLVASYVFINSIPTSINTQLAETKTISLPDTSEVFLNEDSEISYKKNSWEDSRELNLRGEAYFKVAKGKKFTVNTPHGIVEVLGTQFNVLATEDTFAVSCYEGLVAVTYDGILTKLPKGSKLTVASNSNSLSQIAINKPVWLANESSYEDTAILNVLQDLETTYGIKVTTQNIDVTLRYTGSYTHENLNVALQTITIPLGLTYTIESKTSITISPKNTSE